MKVLFAGPSLYGTDSAFEGITVRPPARQGDIHRAALDGATAIALVDGVFGSVASVWHKEILFALDNGVRVIGGASLGALRAAECHAFGMEPIGAIAAEYLSGKRRDDGDVCLVHAPGELDFMPLTEPLVDVEATVAAMSLANVLSAQDAAAILARARRMYFGDRDIDSLLRDAGVPEIAALYRAHRVSAKTADALAVAARLQELPNQRAPKPHWTFVASDPWRYYLKTLAERNRSN